MYTYLTRRQGSEICNDIYRIHTDVRLHYLMQHGEKSFSPTAHVRSPSTEPVACGLQSLLLNAHTGDVITRQDVRWKRC